MSWGDNWDPTGQEIQLIKFIHTNLLASCKAFLKKKTTCIWFTQGHKECNNTKVLQEVQML